MVACSIGCLTCWAAWVDWLPGCYLILLALSNFLAASLSFVVFPCCFSFLPVCFLALFLISDIILLLVLVLLLALSFC